MFGFVSAAVLYIYSITNFDGFRGFRVDDANYSAFPNEQEYLLCEGFKVTVLGAEEDFYIRNKNQTSEN